MGVGDRVLTIAFHLLFDALTRGRPQRSPPSTYSAARARRRALTLFLRSGQLWRVVIAGLAGLAALVLGIKAHAAGAVMTGHRASDFTGIAMALAGVVLVGVALRLSLAGLRRWLQAILVLAAVVVLAQLVLVPAINVSVVTHAPREAMAPASTLALPGARDVRSRPPTASR